MFEGAEHVDAFKQDGEHNNGAVEGEPASLKARGRLELDSAAFNPFGISKDVRLI